MNTYRQDHKNWLIGLIQVPYPVQTEQIAGQLRRALHEDRRADYLKLVEEAPGVCACMFCEGVTAMLGTQHCDRCHEFFNHLGIRGFDHLRIVAATPVGSQVLRRLSRDLKGLLDIVD